MHLYGSPEQSEQDGAHDSIFLNSWNISLAYNLNTIILDFI